MKSRGSRMERILSYSFFAVATLSMFNSQCLKAEDELFLDKIYEERYFTLDKSTEYVDPASRTLYISNNDLVVPGVAGLDIKINRYYTPVPFSASGYRYPGDRTHFKMGYGWNIHFGYITHPQWHSEYYFEDWKLAELGRETPAPNIATCEFQHTVSSNSSMNGIYHQNPSIVHSNGNTEFIVNSLAPDHSYSTKSGFRGGCSSDGYVFYSPEGLKYIFNKVKYLTREKHPNKNYTRFEYAYFVSRIEDKYGNWINVEYVDNDYIYSPTEKGMALVSKVTSNDGREVVFEYEGDHKLDNVKLISISTDGYDVNYIYNEDGNLSKVVIGEDEVWSYQYYYRPGEVGNSKFFGYELKSVTNLAGGVSSYNYLNGKFLGRESSFVSSKIFTNNGVESVVSYSYSKTYGLDEDNASPYPSHFGVRVKEEGKCTDYVFYSGAKEYWNKYKVVRSYIYDSECSSEKYREEHQWGKIKLSEQGIDTSYYAPYVGYIGETKDSAFWLPVLENVKYFYDGSSNLASKVSYSEYSNFGRPGKIKEYDFNSLLREYIYDYEDSPHHYGLEKIKSEKVVLGEHDVELRTYRYYENFDIKSLSELGKVTSYEYHPSGDIKKLEFNVQNTFGIGNRSVEYSNYYRGVARGILTSARENSGTMNRSRTVNNLGRITGYSDFNGNWTYFYYDQIGRLEKIKYGDDNFSAKDISYNFENGRLNKLTSQGNYRQHVTYDGFFNPTKTETWDLAYPDEKVYNIAKFDYRNVIKFESVPSFSLTEDVGIKYKYDELDRISEINDRGLGAISFKYIDGYKVEKVDAKNNKTTTIYQSYGKPDYKRPVLIEQPQSVTTIIEYNIVGDVKQVSQGGISENRFYDVNHQLCLIARPDIGNTVYKKNPWGETIWYVEGAESNSDACGFSQEVYAQRIEITNDNHGEIKEINYPDATPTKTFQRDANGNLTNLTFGTTSWEYDYNSLNKIETETFTLDNVSWVYNSVYNSLGHVSEVTYPSQKKISYAPNALGQPTRIGDYMTGITYHSNGQVKSGTYGNGLAYSQTLDTQQRPQYQTVKRGTIELLNHFYQYDANHNIGAINDLITPSKNISLTYDGLDRLDTASGFWGTGSFDYDSLGNIETKTLGNQSLSYEYDTNNRLTTITGSLNRSFGYDTRGNVTSNGSRAFNFNLANQLVSSGTNSYQYDGYNRRVKKVSNGKTQLSLYNAAGQLLMTDGDNGPTEYFYLGNKLIAKESQVPTSEDTPGYTGHLEDDDLQLTYMQARYYDPVIGRFYSNDPVGFLTSNPMTFNRYAYANNNPYKYTDPDGRTALPFPLTPMDTGVGPTGMQNLTLEQQATGVGTLVDAVPVVGDIKAVAEAVNNPTIANVTAATVGMIPLVGDAAAAAIKTSVTIGKNANQVSHAFRHTDKAGLSRESVTEAVTGAVNAAGDSLKPGLNKMSTDVGGVKVDFSAYKHEDGGVNVGRITPPKE